MARLPKAVVSNQKLIIVLRIVAGASRKANSSPVLETSTSPAVSTMYGSVCHSTLSFSPPATRWSITDTMRKEIAVMKRPAPMRRRVVTRRPDFSVTGKST